MWSKQISSIENILLNGEIRAIININGRKYSRPLNKPINMLTFGDRQLVRRYWLHNLLQNCTKIWILYIHSFYWKLAPFPWILELWGIHHYSFETKNCEKNDYILEFYGENSRLFEGKLKADVWRVTHWTSTRDEYLKIEESRDQTRALLHFVFKAEYLPTIFGKFDNCYIL